MTRKCAEKVDKLTLLQKECVKAAEEIHNLFCNHPMVNHDTHVAEIANYHLQECRRRAITSIRTRQSNVVFPSDHVRGLDR